MTTASKIAELNAAYRKTLLEAVAEAVKESWINVLLALPPTTPGYPALEDSELIKRVTVTIDENANSISLFLPFYEKFIESGRRAGAKQPPVDVIIKWMRRKGIGGGNLNRIAFAIARKIGRDGIKARPFTDTAVEKSTEDAGIIIELATSDWLDAVLFELTR